MFQGCNWVTTLQHYRNSADRISPLLWCFKLRCTTSTFAFIPWGQTTIFFSSLQTKKTISNREMQNRTETSTVLRNKSRLHGNSGLTPQRCMLRQGAADDTKWSYKFSLGAERSAPPGAPLAIIYSGPFSTMVAVTRREVCRVLSHWTRYPLNQLWTLGTLKRKVRVGSQPFVELE